MRRRPTLCLPFNEKPRERREDGRACGCAPAPCDTSLPEEKDVGYGQLAWALRQDPRVVVLERHNIRRLDPAIIPEPIQCAVVDVSFISLKLVLPTVVSFLTQDSFLVALIKPQFEAGREHVGKGGVVKDPAVHEAVCRSVAGTVEALGFHVLGITPSPILGPKGNREFLLAARRRRALWESGEQDGTHPAQNPL